MDSQTNQPKPALIIAGTGIQGLSQITKEAETFLATSDAVYYLSNNPLVTQYILEKRPDAKTLYSYYEVGLNRRITYERMAAALVSSVEEGLNTLGLFYGHPGVFVNPSHHAIRKVRELGFSAYMLPAVSAEDCLYADLLIDPGSMGCQSYEATDFLLYNRIIDITAPLILWQVGVLGHKDYQLNFEQKYVSILQERLISIYGKQHVVTSYVAAAFWHLRPEIKSFQIESLCKADLSPVSTLYIPPCKKPALDKVMAQRLNWNA